MKEYTKDKKVFVKKKKEKVNQKKSVMCLSTEDNVDTISGIGNDLKEIKQKPIKKQAKVKDELLPISERDWSVKKLKAQEVVVKKGEEKKEKDVETVITYLNGEMPKVRKIILPKTSNLFNYREDLLTTQAQMEYYKENDKEKLEMIRIFGEALIHATGDNNLKVVQQIIKANEQDLHLLRWYVEEAFISAVSLKLLDISRFYVLMGLRLNSKKLQLIVHNLAESSRYISRDPPKKLLEFIL